MTKRHRKVLTTLGFLLLIFFFSVSSVSAAELGDRVLRVGSQGEDVKVLQTHLKTLGAYTYSNITGYYGSITQSAVTAFQKYHGLSADGIAGPKTVAKIKSLLGISKTTSSPTTSTSFTRVLREGVRGTDVVKLQDILKQKGYFNKSVASTGYYGTVTKNAVIGFQRANGLATDGIAGPKTQAALQGSSKTTTPPTKESASPSISYTNHTVKAGDNQWSISNKYGITLAELQKANGFTNSTTLQIGQQVKVPQHVIPVTWAPTSYGENLDWWTQAQYVFPINAVAKMIVLNDDGSIPFGTAREARTVTVKRTMGANHSDTEPLTYGDAMKMKKIWGGSFSWIRKPVLLEVEYRGQVRRIAASSTSMGHAGVDAAPAFANVANRSDGYGYGENYDVVKGNGMDGHFDIHFKNSTRHKDGQTDWNHQEMIKISAGLK